MIENPIVTYTIKADNTDQCGGGIAQSTFVLTILTNNLCPRRTSQPVVQPPILCQGSSVDLSFSQYFYDPEGNTITYSIFGMVASGANRFEDTGLMFNESTGRLAGNVSWWDAEKGETVITVEATDSFSCTPERVTTTLRFGKTKRPPVAEPRIPSPIIAIQGEPFAGMFNLHFYDPDWEPLIYSVSGLPPGSGLSIGPNTGIMTGTPNIADVYASPMSLRIHATNEMHAAFGEFRVCPAGGGRVYQDLTIVVELGYQVTCDKPIVASSESRSASVGRYFSFDTSKHFKNQNMGSLTYAMSGAPRGSGLKIDTLFGHIHGIPTHQDLQLSPLQLIIEAFNAQGGSCETYVIIRITDAYTPTPAPVLTRPPSEAYCGVLVNSVPDALFTPGYFLSVDLSTHVQRTGTGNVLFDVSGLPPGTGLKNSGTGYLSGVPSDFDIRAAQTTGGFITLRTIARCVSGPGHVEYSWRLRLSSDGSHNPCSAHPCELHLIPILQDDYCQCVCPPATQCNEETIIVKGTIAPEFTGCQEIALNLTTAFASEKPLTYSIVGTKPGSGLTMLPDGTLAGVPTAVDCSMSQPMFLYIFASNGQVQAHTAMFLSTYCDDVTTCSKGLYPSHYPYRPLPPAVQVVYIPPAHAAVCQRFVWELSSYFSRVETSLQYSLLGLPQGSGLSIHRTQGVISGVPSKADCASAPLTLTVVAWDTSSREFRSFVQIQFMTCQCSGEPPKQPSLTSIINLPGLSSLVGNESAVHAKATLGQQFFFENPNRSANLIFMVDGILPGSGFKAGPKGSVFGSPSAIDCAAGVVPLRISGRDGFQEAFVLFVNIVVDCSSSPMVPTPFNGPVDSHFSLVPEQEVYVGAMYRLDATKLWFCHSCDPLLPTQYHVTGLPSGSGLSMSQGILQGQPSQSDCMARPQPLKIIISATQLGQYKAQLPVYFRFTCTPMGRPRGFDGSSPAFMQAPERYGYQNVPAMPMPQPAIMSFSSVSVPSPYQMDDKKSKIISPSITLDIKT